MCVCTYVGTYVHTYVHTVLFTKNWTPNGGQTVYVRVLFVPMGFFSSGRFRNWFMAFAFVPLNEIRYFTFLKYRILSKNSSF